ncbi:hypothetical protein VPH35_134005 [Triticum aestivum]
MELFCGQQQSPPPLTCPRAWGRRDEDGDVAGSPAAPGHEFPPLPPTPGPHLLQGLKSKYAEHGGARREMRRPSPKCFLSPVSFLPLSVSLSLPRHHHPRPISPSPSPDPGQSEHPNPPHPAPPAAVSDASPAADPRKTQEEDSRRPPSGAGSSRPRRRRELGFGARRGMS